MTDLGERTLKCYLLHTGSIAEESEFETGTSMVPIIQPEEKHTMFQRIDPDKLNGRQKEIYNFRSQRDFWPTTASPPSSSPTTGMGPTSWLITSTGRPP